MTIDDMIGPRARRYAAEATDRRARGMGAATDTLSGGSGSIFDLTTTSSATGGSATQTFNPTINVGPGAGGKGGASAPNSTALVLGGLATFLGIGALVLLGGDK